MAEWREWTHRRAMFLENLRPRPTLGLLVSHIDGTYQLRFWRGLRNFCRYSGCDLVVYASRFWRGQSDPFRDQEQVYRLAGPRRIDALCVDGSAFRDQAHLDAFLASRPDLATIPAVFSSIGSPDTVRVIPDNAGGMRQALSHLHRVHGCRRFAFVGGPGDLEDARERREAFGAFLADHGLAPSPDWIREGAFDPASGRDATAAIVTSPSGIPEAIVYANDLMAMGGLEELRHRGIAVPGTVRVTGFDGDDLSRLQDPPLSTAAQPIEAKAWRAGRALLDALQGRPPVRPLPLGTRFLPRESCGCARCAENPALPDANRLLVDSRMAIALISRITEYLGSVLDLQELADRLALLVPSLGCGMVWVALSGKDDLPEFPGGDLALICAVDADGTLRSGPGHPRRFPAEQLVPPLLGPATRSDLFIQILRRNDRGYGILAMECGNADPAVMVALRDQISECLYRISQVQELARSRTALQEALHRATESERSYRELARTLPVFLMETGPDGSINFLNDTARVLLGTDLPEGSAVLRLRDIMAPGARPPAVPAPGHSGETAPWTDLVLRSRAGHRIHLLVRHGMAGTGRRRWCGFDYRPVLESLTDPGSDFLHRHDLTRREAQVLARELRGLSAKEIAGELSISLSTVKGHLGSIYRKAGVGSRDQLFRLLGRDITGTWGRESLVLSLLSGVLRP